MSVADAPDACEYDVKDAAIAWEKVKSADLNHFAWCLFSFPENLFAKTLDVHESASDTEGITGMLEQIEELTSKNTPCWGAYKIHEVGANASSVTAKFIGFQYIPSKAKINAKRVAKEVAPSVQTLLEEVSLFLECDSTEKISDSVENVASLSEQLGLATDAMIQFHNVDVKPVTPHWLDASGRELDDFAWIICTVDVKTPTRKLACHQSREGGLLELVQEIQARADTGLCWGGFRVNVVGKTTGQREAKFVIFQYATVEAQAEQARVIAELRPHVLGPYLTTSPLLDIVDPEELKNVDALHVRLGLTEDQVVQLNLIRNISGASEALQELFSNSEDIFPWVLVTAEETVMGRETTLAVTKSVDGGISELREAVEKAQGPCWACAKVLAVEAAKAASKTTTHYVAFHYAPEATKSSDPSLLNAARPHMRLALGKAQVFMELTKVDEIGDKQLMGKKLELAETHTLQYHAVDNVSAVETQWEKIQQSTEDDFDYILIRAETSASGNKTLSVSSKHQFGGFTEMCEEIKTLPGGVCWGVFKVQIVEKESAERVTKCIAFQYMPEITPDVEYLIAEVRPHINAAIKNEDVPFIETGCLDNLGRDALTNVLGLSSAQVLQHHTVVSDEAAAAWKEVTATVVDDFSYALFVVAKNQYKKTLEVHRGTEGGMTEMLEKIKELTAEGRACWGGFKVQSVDDTSLLRKKPKRMKFVGFQYCTDEAKPEMLEVIPYAIIALNKPNLDMFIDTADINDISDVQAISTYLKQKDEWTFYEFGGTIRCRTEIIVDVSGFGTQNIEVASALDAWDLVLSNSDHETYCIFALSPNRKKLQVVAHGGGAGLKACQVAVQALLCQNLPVWGCFRLHANCANKAQVVKFIGFQLIPEGTPPLTLSAVNLVKPLLMKTLKQAVIWIEALDEGCFSEEVISKKLEKHAAETELKPEFGEELSEEAKAVLLKKVENYFLNAHTKEVDAQVDGPGEAGIAA